MPATPAEPREADDADVNSRTLFVRNLSYSTTQNKVSRRKKDKERSIVRWMDLMSETRRCYNRCQAVSMDVALKQLENLFAAVGPVRQAFVVGESEVQGHKHKGFGFVKL